jgi:(p)ppGpp synthase/HD superfamily hydrolase
MNKNQELLSRAINIATLYHKNQFDKAGVPYIFHCIKVMHYLKTDDEELKCIALLHDILEDTECTSEILYKEGMTNRIIVGVIYLTKVKSVTYDEYLENIKKNLDAVKVKLCDLRHNSDIRRLKNVEQKDFDRIQKYHKMYQDLIALNY